MIFSKDYIGYLARQTTKHLVAVKMIKTDKPELTNQRVAAALIDELALEDRINEEVRVILEAFQDDMHKSGASYPEMFKKVSRDKLNKLAHTVADTLAEIDEVEFMEDRNTIRQEARKALEKLLTEETRIDAAARQKIASQRRIIPEGSQEWDILYRKYYNDEVKKLGL
jgi:hypothetical protein